MPPAHKDDDINNRLLHQSLFSRRWKRAVGKELDLIFFLFSFFLLASLPPHLPALPSPPLPVLSPCRKMSVSSHIRVCSA